MSRHSTPLPPREERQTGETSVEGRRMRGAVANTLFGPAQTRETTLGRFVLLEVLGAGGMGIVYRAYDPTLDRAVAVKLLREGTSPQLLREAKAMARLNHPHVVSVHEVGVHEGSAFVAMELVSGGTLRTFTAASSPDGSERVDGIVRLMLQVARGLAAAHAAGLVHRDVKPQNVLLTTEGDAKIADFGLARAEEKMPTIGNAAPGSDGATVSGGTPAYMAPEQFAGESDARSDQFSFCVAFFEALHGRRPFAGKDRKELARAVNRGDRADVPLRPDVPQWLNALLNRGLSCEPSDRFADMRSLIGAVERGRSRTQTVRRTIAVGGVAAAIVVGAFFADSPGSCPDGGPLVDPQWDDAARGQARTAFEATAYPGWAWAFQRVETNLTEFAAAWGKAQRHACLEPSPAQTLCLDEARTAFRVLTGEIVRADLGTVERATSAILALPDPSRCARAEPVSSAGEARSKASSALARATVLHVLWKRTEARAAYEEAVALAREAEAPAVASAGLAAISELEARDGKGPKALEIARAALVEAEASGLDSAMAIAWRVVGAAAVRTGQLEDADFYLERGLNQTRREPERFAQEHAMLLVTLASLRADQNRDEEAIELFDEALARFEELGAATDHIGSIRTMQCTSLMKVGRLDAAIEAGYAAVAAIEARHGSQHPMLVAALVNVAGAHQRKGDIGALVALMGRAAAIASDHPDHPPEERLLASTSFANALILDGRDDDAYSQVEEALGRDAARLGGDNPAVLNARTSLASIDMRARRYAAAAKRLRPLAGLAQTNERLWPDLRAAIVLNLAVCVSHLGDHEEAVTLARQAVEEFALPSPPLQEANEAVAAQIYERAEATAQ